MKIIRITCMLLLSMTAAYGQILPTESFTVILDSTKTIKGTVIPNFKFKNLRKDLFEFENSADLSARIGNNAITIANKIELAKFGEEKLLSGGYIYSEYRNSVEKKIGFEFYSQIHWAEARGLNRKYAVGVNSRWRLVNKPTLALFLGFGPFYEYEKWNFDGTPAEKIPADETPIEKEKIKIGTYLSLKYAASENIFLDVSFYYQSEFDELITTPRFASSSRITYQFSRYIGFSLLYQNIYDFNPIVPIDKLYHNMNSGFIISF